MLVKKTISPFDVKENEEPTSREGTSSSSGIIRFPEKETKEHNSSSASSYEEEETPKIVLTSRKDSEEGEAIEETDDEDIDRYEDDELRKTINERLRAYRYEVLKEEEPSEIEMKEVKVDLKKEMIFTIPMNTKDPAEVKQSIKGLIEYIEDKLKLTVDKIHGVKDGPSLREAYEVLDDWYRERHIKRIREEGLGVEPKKPRINMMRYKGSGYQGKGSGYQGKGSKGYQGKGSKGYRQKGKDSKGSESKGSKGSESKGSKGSDEKGSKGLDTKGQRWRELDSEGSLLNEYGDELRFQDRIVERGYILGTAGSLAKRSRDQELWDLNEEKNYLYHKQGTLRYKGPSREKD